MKTLQFPKYVAAAFAATLISASCWADTAIFQEGISDANGPNPAYNMEVGYMTSGFGGTLQATDVNHQIGGLNGAYGRTVMRWDIGSLAGKGTITGATAKITFEPVVRYEILSVPKPDPFKYHLYRLTDGNKQWIDSQVGNARQKTGVPWTGSTGAGTSGTDYFATPIAEVEISGGADIMAKQVLTFNFTDISFLQDWADNPGNNAGFLLRAELLEAAGGFPGGATGYAQGTMFPDDVTNASGPGGRYPNAVAADRPILEITYRGVVPEPGSVLLVLSGSLILLGRRWRRGT